MLLGSGFGFLVCHESEHIVLRLMPFTGVETVEVIKKKRLFCCRTPEIRN